MRPLCYCDLQCYKQLFATMFVLDDILADSVDEIPNESSAMELLTLPLDLPELKFLEQLLDCDNKAELIQSRITHLKANPDHAKEMFFMDTYALALMRLPAITVTIALELMVGLIISCFHDLLKANILMTSFMPILTSISGNVGLQASTATVRGISAGLLTQGALFKILRKEWASATIIGTISGTIMFVVALIWSQELSFALTTALSQMLSASFAGLWGSLGPVIFKYYGKDPAVMAGPFETASQDFVGTLLFLGIASSLLSI